MSGDLTFTVCVRFLWLGYHLILGRHFSLFQWEMANQGQSPLQCGPCHFRWTWCGGLCCHRLQRGLFFRWHHLQYQTWFLRFRCFQFWTLGCGHFLQLRPGFQCLLFSVNWRRQERASWRTLQHPWIAWGESINLGRLGTKKE